MVRSMVSEREVWDALKEIIEPEFGVNIVDMGLVYGVDVENDEVKVRMTLLSMGCAGCSIMRLLPEQVEERLRAIDGVKNARVELTFDPPWSPERMSEDARKSLGLL